MPSVARSAVDNEGRIDSITHGDVPSREDVTRSEKHHAADAGTLRSMWRPLDEPWQYRVLDAVPPSIDVGQLERALAMTPEERILAVMELMKAGEELRRGLRQSGRDD